MTIFKGYMLVIKHNLGSVFLYFGIFIVISIANASFYDDNNDARIETKTVSIAIFNEDNGVISTGLESYLTSIHVVKQLENNEDIIQEALYYRDIQYVINIPQGFSESIQTQEAILEVTKVPGLSDGYYVDAQINTYMNQVYAYRAAGFSELQTIQKIEELQTISADIHLVQDPSNRDDKKIKMWFSFLPYLFITVICGIISIILITFRNKELRKRMLCSNVSDKRLNLIALLSFLIVSSGVYIVSVGLPILMYHEYSISQPILYMYLINALAFLLVSLAIAYLVGTAMDTLNSINSVTTLLSLGMCFLGGVFIPQYLIAEEVLVIAKFLPTYWYILLNDTLGQSLNKSSELMHTLGTCIGMQLVFAFACICIALAISKAKIQE